MFFHIWNIFVIAVCIFSSIKYAIYAAFRSDVDFSSYMEYYEHFNFGLVVVHKFKIEDIQFYDNLQLFFEGIFLIELCFGFITEYVDENMERVRNIKKIS